MKNTHVIIVLAAAWAAAVLYRSPYRASNLETVPDAVEYANTAYRLVKEGRITLPIENREFPSRYQPWFSLMVILPAYIWPGAQPGWGIFPVWLLGMLGAVTLATLARKCAGDTAAAAAALLLMVGTDYTLWGRKILTDVPAAAMLMLALYWTIRGQETDEDSATSEGTSARVLWATMALVAATLWRPAFGIFGLSLVGMSLRRRNWKMLVVVAAAFAFSVAVLLAYNYAVFGHPLRSGYLFWCSDIFGVKGTAFALQHVMRNVSTILGARTGWVWGIGIGGFLFPSVRAYWRDHAPARNILLWAAWSCPVFALLHFLYFFPDTRFFLPLSALMALLGGVHMGVILTRVPPLFARFAFAGLIAAFCVWRAFFYEPEQPLRRIAADLIREHTSADATVVTTLDPVYLKMMLGYDDRRHLIPLSRRMEYASKKVMISWIEPKRSPDSIPAVQYVAAEQVADLQRRIEQGEQIYVETVLVDANDLGADFQRLRQELMLAPVTDYLWVARRSGRHIVPVYE